MGNYEQLKQAVADVIKTNGNQEITGEILQNALLYIISTIGTNATFAGIATPTTNPGTPDQNVFYIASENGTYSNFGSIILSEEVAILSNKGGSWVKSSKGIATSAKVTELEKEVIYDVTANNDGVTFDSLSELLSSENLSTLIPTSVRHGGMTIRFVQSYDNKYVQYRLISDIFNTTESNWQGVDDEPTAGSENLVKSGGVFVSLNDLSSEVAKKIDATNFNNQLQKKADKDDVTASLIALENKIGERTEIAGDVVNNPDEEDLTTQEGKLSFKDRAYEPLTYSGKGYKILRKNMTVISIPSATITVLSTPTKDGYISVIVDGVEIHIDVTTDDTIYDLCKKIATEIEYKFNKFTVAYTDTTVELTGNYDFTISDVAISAVDTGAMFGSTINEKIQRNVNLLTQDMIVDENTIYEIRYDFELNGASITVPDSSIIKFNGGILRNGIISSNVYSDKYSKIFDNVIVDSDNVYVTWFDDIDNIKEDATNAFKQAIRKSSQAFYKTVHVPKGTYNITDTLECMNMAIVGDSEYRENVKIILNINADIPLFHIKDKKGTTYSEFVLKNLCAYGYYISSLERVGIGVLNDETSPSFMFRIENCIISRFSVGIKVYCAIDSIIKDSFITYNYDGFITYKPASNIGTSTTFDHCYIQANLRHITIEPNSMIDLRFTNGTIFEVAKDYVIHVKGGIPYLLIDQCYFEANSYGYDWNGAIQNDENVKENILWIEASSADVNARYYTYVISNSFVSGSNNWSKLGKVITANAGVIQFTNNVFTRFKTIFDLVSGYTGRNTKFSITFKSSYYGGSSAELFTEESLTLLKSTNDDLNIDYYASGKIVGYANPTNIRPSNTNSVTDGIENAPGTAGALNNISIKKDGNCIAAFNTRGVAIIGNSQSNKPAQANAQSNSLCLLNGNNLLPRINNERDDKLHSYIQSVVDLLQTRLFTYVYRSDTNLFEQKYLMDFALITSTDLATKEPSKYRYIIYYLTDKSVFAISNKTKWVDFNGNPIFAANSGTFEEKPSSNSGIKVGFSYFCTDRQTAEGQSDGIMIYYKGNNIWVDALGRTIS